jgi:glycosyltransferase involved in cell wall biosynthesis
MVQSVKHAVVDRIGPHGTVAARGPDEPVVLQIIDNLSLGGAQRLLITLARHVAAQSSLRVLALSDDDTPMRAELTAAGARLTEMRNVRLWSVPSWWRVWRAIRQSGADVVHVHLTYATILAAPIARLQGKRVIVSLHNADTARGAGGRRRLRHAVLHWLEDFSLRHCTDHVIFVGENVARSNRARIGRTPGTMIRNVIAAPDPVAAENRAATRAAMGADEGDVVLISTGRLMPQKDPAGLLHAFALVAGQTPQARLWMVGTGPMQDEIAALRDALGLRDRILLTGERGDVARLLAAADAFVLSSAWEGLPLGLLEAMAQGLPVVSTDVGDVAHVLPARAGGLVPPGRPDLLARALLPLLSDATVRRDCGSAALAAARDFTDVAGWYRQLRHLYGNDDPTGAVSGPIGKGA